MKRSEIELKYKWNQEHTYPTFDDFMNDYHLIKKVCNQCVAMKDHICDNMNSFIDFMEHKEIITVKLSKLCAYASMKNDVESDDPTNNKALVYANQLQQEVNDALSFVNVEFMKNETILNEYLKAEACADFIYPTSEILRYKPHTLDQEQEIIMAQMSELASAPYTSYNSLRMEHEDVVIDGVNHFLNGGNYNSFLVNPSQAVRKQAFEKYLKEYQKYQGIFANLLTTHAKGQISQAKLRNFDSALQASLFKDGVDEKLFNLVCTMGNGKYLPYLHEYFALRKQLLNLDEQHIYDLNVPLVSSINKKYPIDEAFKILKEALAPLGNDYNEMVDVAIKQRWIDIYPHEKKRSGAYSHGTHETLPFILLNYNNTYDSMSTLAHEFGHSMHSYYSSKNNRGLLSRYTIFVAEAASTVNELLLADYLLKNSDDKKLKASIIAGLLETLVGTLYRQTMYAQFEVELHNAFASGNPLSSSEIADLFLKLNREHYGKDVIVDDLQGYRCYAIPHFYMNFYVYKYTLGMSVAIAFFKQIKAGTNQHLKYFLTRGGSTSPVQSFIDSKVDPYDPNLYDEAFTYFKELLDEFKNLMKD